MTEPHAALATTLAEERLRIVATLIRTTGDWDLAEDAVADAAERALTRWPVDGVPERPAAWLTTVARRRAVDLIRRAGTERRKLEEVAAVESLRDDVAPAGPLDDDRLRLVFTCCHPALSLESRVALTLKVVAGLSTESVARAFLTTPATMGQRLLRAKQKIANAAIPYRVPDPTCCPRASTACSRWSTSSSPRGTPRTQPGSPTRRSGSAGCSCRWCRPDHADEARSLLALMLLQHSRRDARLVDGELVPLEQQDRGRWDSDAIDEARELLAVPTAKVGSYRLQAELAAQHAVVSRAEDTDWPAIVSLYDQLLGLTPSPVVALNRAVAVGMSDGPLAGLAALDGVATDRRLDGNPMVAATRGDLLERAGLRGEAAREFGRAADLATTDVERRALLRRLALIEGDR